MRRKLLGQYMWDFGGKREMPVELMSNQLMASERLPKSRQISGLIFHCTPLVDLALAAVNLSRKWIAEHRNEVVWCAKQSSIATCEMKGVRAD